MVGVVVDVGVNVGDVGVVMKEGCRGVGGEKVRKIIVLGMVGWGDGLVVRMKIIGCWIGLKIGWMWLGLGDEGDVGGWIVRDGVRVGEL